MRLSKTAFFHKFLYVISFMEGAALMSTELLGAKMMAPFFGSSLYVWATILGVTLGGLAIGYFIGGYLSTKYKDPKALYYVILLAGICIMTMPFTAKYVMNASYGYSLTVSLFFSSTVFLFPPMILLGMVSPLIIELLSGKEGESGKSAGSVYAVSTTGGILATFFVGFYAIPYFGLTMTTISTGIILGLLPFTTLVIAGNSYVIYFLFLSFYVFNLSNGPVKDTGAQVVHDEEGLLGQVMVVDFPADDSAESINRYLYFNHIVQTATNTYKDTSLLKYVKLIDRVVKLTPAEGTNKRRALLLGLGGGSVAKVLRKNKYEVDACEFDKRIVKVAREYFKLPSSIKVYNGDARYFIRHAEKKYDLVVFDVFKGEETPNHVITLESMDEVKGMLNKGGMIIVNGNGYWDGNTGKGMRSVMKTLKAAGFEVSVFPTEKSEIYRNLLFTAQLVPTMQNDSNLLTIADANNQLADAEVLTDDKPILDVLNKDANKAWRWGYIQYSIHELSKNDIEIFN